MIEELDQYIQTFSKVAEYMNWLAESYIGKEPVCSLLNRKEAVLDDLKRTMAKKENTPRVRLATALHDVWTTYVPPSGNHHPELLKVWKALFPQNLRYQKPMITDEEFLEAMGMTKFKKDALKEEWNRYIVCCLCTS